MEFLIIAIVVCAWHEARYTNVGGIWEVIYNNILLIGPLLYAYFQMLIFYESMSDSYARNREYAFLSRLAYEDGLTKLPNRSRIDAYLTRLENAKNDYCIISLDLDGLKRVNDTFGHWAGDKLLMTFGNALDSVFSKDHLCGRIGGDEFMAVLTGVDATKVDAILEKLQETLTALNEAAEDPWEYSCAAGYAFRHECSEDHMHNTYLLADQRMYRQKEEHHKKAAQK
jgi:diguanylate cyclase (GGDEF)-like protein